MSMILNPYAFATAVAGFWATIHGASSAADSFNPDGQLTKTASTGWGNCGAFSVTNFARTASLALKWPAASNSLNTMQGLSRTDTGDSYTDVEFGIAQDVSNAMAVIESGTTRMSGTKTPTNFYVFIDSAGEISYWADGELLWLSAATAASASWFAKLAMNNNGAVAGDFQLTSPLPSLPTFVVWTATGGVTEASHTLTSTVGGWGNSGAFSSQSTSLFTRMTYKNDTTGVGTSRIVGLSNTDANKSYASIQYGWLMQANNLYIFESGSLISGPTALGSSIMSIEYQAGSNQMVYRKDGSTVRTATSVPSGPYFVDCALESSGSTIPPIGLI